MNQATGINDSGTIVGYGTTTAGATHGFELQLMPGDANLDGKVDINDLTKVLTDFGATRRRGVGRRRFQPRRQGRHQRPDHCVDQLRP